MNILYLGMANDIMSPLLLVPDFDILYVIDKFDFHFSSDRKTFKRQKQDIKDVLIEGSDKTSFWKIFHEEDSHIRCTHYLETPSTIIDESDDGTVWRLKFNYNDKIRELVFYHHRDFLIEWPIEIQNISHIMCMGALSWTTFVEKDCTILLKILEERTLKPFYFYALHFMHKHFPKWFIVMNGNERNGIKVARTQIKNMSKWEKKIYGQQYEFCGNQVKEDSSDYSSDSE